MVKINIFALIDTNSRYISGFILWGVNRFRVKVAKAVEYSSRLCVTHQAQNVVLKVEPTGLVVSAWKSFGWAKAWSVGQLFFLQVFTFLSLLIEVSTAFFFNEKKKKNSSQDHKMCGKLKDRWAYGGHSTVDGTIDPREVPGDHITEGLVSIFAKQHLRGYPTIVATKPTSTGWIRYGTKHSQRIRCWRWFLCVS
jgi:hypothetical protein